MDVKMITDKLVRASMGVKVADEAFEALVKPYEQILHSMGFKPSVDHDELMKHNVSTWHMKIDPEKYDGDAIAVTINPEKISIVAGMAAFSHLPSTYEWTYHMKQLPASRLRSTITSHLWEMEKSVAKIARQLLAMAKRIIVSDRTNALNGLRVQVAKRYVNKILDQHSKGFFSDQSWEGINKVWKALDDNGIVYTMTGAEYQKDESGMPVRKQWKFEVEFWNEKGRMVKIYGVMIASGAGSVEDPLDKYDIIAYVS